MQKLYEYEKSGLEYYAAGANESTTHKERRLIFDENEPTQQPEQLLAKDPGNPYKIMFRWILQEI
jgi:hypothetical protein